MAAGVQGLGFTGQVMARLGATLVRPRRLRLTALVHHMQEVGLNAVPIVALMGFLIGVVLAFQGATQLRQFGAEVFVVDLITEVTPVTMRTRPRRAFVDRGYRGHGVVGTDVFISGQRRGMTPALKRDLKRRSAIEPTIGHMKTDGRLARCPLKGTIGDAVFAVLCGCGHNIRLILAHLRKLVAVILAFLFGATALIVRASRPPEPRIALQA